MTNDSGGGCNPGGTQCHFIARGEAADVNWFDPGEPPGDTSSFPRFTYFGFLSVSRSGSQSDPQTFLSFSVTECRGFSCSTVRGGFGLIPNEDLQGNTHSLTLSTNTSGNPNFFTYAGGTGQIDVTWSSSGTFERRTNGTTEIQTPDFREHTSGQSTFVAAAASGFVLALRVFPGGSASIFTSRNVTVDVFR